MYCREIRKSFSGVTTIMNTRDCGHIISGSSPAKGEAGKTGEWRTQRPVVNKEKCLSAKANKDICYQCWAFCPECAIERKPGGPVDLTYCKGCGICAQICPADAIQMESEYDSSEQRKND